MKYSTNTSVKIQVRTLRFLRENELVGIIDIEPNRINMYFNGAMPTALFNVVITEEVVFKCPKSGMYKIQALDMNDNVVITWEVAAGLGDTIFIK